MKLTKKLIKEAIKEAFVNSSVVQEENDWTKQDQAELESVLKLTASLSREGLWRAILGKGWSPKDRRILQNLQKKAQALHDKLEQHWLNHPGYEGDEYPDESDL